MLVCTPNEINDRSIGVHMSTEKEIIVRDSQPRGAGKSPPFHMRISPELKAQLEAEAERDGTSLANWLKELARRELITRGIEPKG